MNKTSTKYNEQGFIKIIIAVIILIVILSLLKVDIRGIFESEAFKTNFAYVGELVSKAWVWIVGFWNDHLKEPSMYLWNLILTNLNIKQQ